MAHAIVAQRNGVEVDGITLWLLGGVARLRGEAPTPGVDFRISVIGPVTSLVGAGVFGAAAWLAELADLNGLVVAVPSFLAAINVVLAVFNTIPAAPLDGGRILRAAVWACKVIASARRCSAGHWRHKRRPVVDAARLIHSHHGQRRGAPCPRWPESGSATSFKSGR
jgi:Zn-dependent protease